MSQSLAKAMRLLSHLGQQPKGVGVRELARLSGCTPSTVHALLQTLQAGGFVEVDEDRQYRLGLAVAVLGATVDRVASLQAAAKPVVEGLFAELGESTTAVAWLDGRALVVHRHQSQHQLVTMMPGGEVEQPHLWASGQVLLAFQPEAVIAGYAAHRLPPEAAARLVAELAAVRARGHAEAVDTGGSGIAALGVPVVDGVGQVRLSLAVSAPLSRFPAPRRAAALAALLAAAGHLATTFGAAA